MTYERTWLPPTTHHTCDAQVPVRNPAIAFTSCAEKAVVLLEPEGGLPRLACRPTKIYFCEEHYGEFIHTRYQVA